MNKNSRLLLAFLVSSAPAFAAEEFFSMLMNPKFSTKTNVELCTEFAKLDAMRPAPSYIKDYKQEMLTEFKTRSVRCKDVVDMKEISEARKQEIERWRQDEEIGRMQANQGVTNDSVDWGYVLQSLGQAIGGGSQQSNNQQSNNSQQEWQNATLESSEGLRGTLDYQRCAYRTLGGYRFTTNYKGFCPNGVRVDIQSGVVETQ